MAGYLLKAPDDVMARWKAVAKERGCSFAEFVRACIEAEVAGPVGLKVVVAPVEEVRPVAPKVVPGPSRVRSPVDPQAGKRSYEPDFKRGAKKA